MTDRVTSEFRVRAVENSNIVLVHDSSELLAVVEPSDKFLDDSPFDIEDISEGNIIEATVINPDSREKVIWMFESIDSIEDVRVKN